MMRNVPLGVYVPGETVIHRIPPLAKICFLIVFVIATTALVAQPFVALLCVIFSSSLYVLAKIPLPIAWGQLWPPAVILLFLGAFQWWQKGLTYSSSLVLAIFASLMLAMLLTLTTSLESMMEAIQRLLAPTERFGVPVETITLAFSLTLRLIPLMLATVYEVLDARKARGATFSLIALGTPVMIRSIRRARGIADALMARGAGD
ncbi:energy-coupling factor transporter transmembrane protein EcfT [Corynebacterium pseudotuberculosis]|uniref:Energy-coupling factor transporter transmembrane protein EcfT n=2 Tax=Corynebacterium pseudotuberculosis TaxID=1719 RepID=D9QAZ8_CORP2|nr:energy-coupling factor transporter transmembrane protein EcfT [Corynebacterium pseudotuberculosis]AER69298.1 Cobalt transport protein cbiQ [Corynebacterium pseudotuberculosis 1/06-A]ADK29051.1 energy-coupling factor transporter transmembrane protein EcfT [Corynebacterium pseudotuberculosis FRC41]ADL10724.1 energy-coupling factor transporter transmembrane protein EcfT [Corynebacterium pseudotuberculosis C231]ADL21132.1 energy-coupling factor transporter transmembrane protein EcfT [Corynebacte